MYRIALDHIKAGFVVTRTPREVQIHEVEKTSWVDPDTGEICSAAVNSTVHRLSTAHHAHVNVHRVGYDTIAVEITAPGRRPAVYRFGAPDNAAATPSGGVVASVAAAAAAHRADPRFTPRRIGSL